MDNPDELSLVQITSDIVGAFVANNPLRAAEMPALITAVHSALQNITASKLAAEPVPELKPAVSIKKSITDDYLICLDDGQKFQSMKRHLAGLGMTPDEYRAKWGLPKDYPMVAPGYAAKRSALARASGLGRKDIAPAPATTPPPIEQTPANDAVAPKRKVAAKVARAPEPEIVAVEAPAKQRGRPKKAA